MESRKTLKYLFAAIAIVALAASLILAYSPSPSQAQSAQDSDDLARFVAVMQYIRSQPTPSDVDQNLFAAFFDLLDTRFSEIYITGFITPFTDETAEQVEARLQSVPEEDRFTAVTVESYRLVSDHTLLNILHNLLARYYVDTFITNTDLSGAFAYLGGTNIESLADAFDSSDYNLPVPSATQPTPASSPTASATPTPEPTPTTVPTPTPTAMATPTPTPTPVPWANWDRFTHNDAGYNIAVAPGWGRIGNWRRDGGALMARFAPLAEGGDESDVWVDIHNDDPPLTLTELAQRQRDETIEAAAESSWQHFQILSFEQKMRDGKSFYELAYRRQMAEDSCIKRVVIRKFASGYADKPYGFDVRYRVCEDRLNALESILETMLDSFTETSDWNPIAVPTPIPNHIINSGTLTPLGDWVVTDDDFAVRVNSTLPNPETLYGDGPAPGRQFFLINITVQNLSNTRQNFSPYRFSAVGASAVEYEYSSFGSDGCGSVPGVFDGSRDLFSGGVVSGNICFSVRNSDVNSLVLYLDPRSSNQIEHWFDLGPAGGRDRYTNGVYRYRIDVAPDWIFDENTLDPSYVGFDRYDSDGNRPAWISFGSWYLGYHSTLSEFANERRDSLRTWAQDNDWELFEITSFRKKTDGGREYYELVYRLQTEPEYCVSRRYSRIMLSSQYPEPFAIDPDDKPYGYYLRSSICESSVNEYRGEVEAMMGNFGEWLR